jgi:hypothetical protein
MEDEPVYENVEEEGLPVKAWEMVIWLFSVEFGGLNLLFRGSKE